MLYSVCQMTLTFSMSNRIRISRKSSRKESWKYSRNYCRIFDIRKQVWWNTFSHTVRVVGVRRLSFVSSFNQDGFYFHPSKVPKFQHELVWVKASSKQYEIHAESAVQTTFLNGYDDLISLLNKSWHCQHTSWHFSRSRRYYHHPLKFCFWILKFKSINSNWNVQNFIWMFFSVYALSIFTW